MSKVDSDEGPGRSGRDPMTGAFVVMRDAWLEGIGAMVSASRSLAAGNLGVGAPGEAVSRMLGALADAATGKGVNSTMDGRHNSTAADVVLPIGHAMMIASNRSASYWLSLAQISARHQAGLARAVGVVALGGGEAGSAHLDARDELRALLREVGDLTAREARLMQHELGALSESLTQTLQPPGPDAPYRRRWRAKA